MCAYAWSGLGSLQTSHQFGSVGRVITIAIRIIVDRERLSVQEHLLLLSQQRRAATTWALIESTPAGWWWFVTTTAAVFCNASSTSTRWFGDCASTTFRQEDLLFLLAIAAFTILPCVILASRRCYRRWWQRHSLRGDWSWQIWNYYLCRRLVIIILCSSFLLSEREPSAAFKSVGISVEEFAPNFFFHIRQHDCLTVPYVWYRTVLVADSLF